MKDEVGIMKEAGFDVLVACAFNYEAHTTEFNKLGRIPVLKARMNADLHMSEDLKNTGKGNLFVIFGEPDITLIDEADGRLVWSFPPLDQRSQTDASWTSTLVSLRTPRKQNQKITDWRREAQIRPVVFEDAGLLDEDTVHLHLEQRVAQRLLARFRCRGSSIMIFHGSVLLSRRIRFRASSCWGSFRSMATAPSDYTRSCFRSNRRNGRDRCRHMRARWKQRRSLFWRDRCPVLIAGC
jgi:hypothetical protein